MCATDWKRWRGTATNSQFHSWGCYTVWTAVQTSGMGRNTKIFAILAMVIDIARMIYLPGRSGS